MDAVILAAGGGDGLRPLTTELPEPMVPVLDRPLMAHTVDLLHRHGVERIAVNLHRFPERVRGYFGDELVYRTEREQLGTAGGVRGLYPLLDDGGPFLVVSGDVLTDVDLDALLERHRAAGGMATLCVKAVPWARGFGLVTSDDGGRVTAFGGGEAGPGVVNCGIYVLEPEIFEHFPAAAPVDFARDVFPALLERGVPFHVHELVSDYWMDVGSPRRLRQATFDLVSGRVALPVAGDELDEGLVLGEGSSLDGVALVEPPVWIGADAEIGVNTHLEGPIVIGDGASVGDGAQLRESIVWPGSMVPRETILIGAIAGHAQIVEAYAPRQRG